MTRHLRIASICGLCLAALIAIAAPPDSSKSESSKSDPPKPPDTTKADEQTLKSAGVGTEDAALLEFFRAKTLNDVDREKISKLVSELGDDAFAIREKASNELVQAGAKAESLLKKALSNRDVEIARRAEFCLEKIEKKEGVSVTVAAARLLAARKPADSAETLLKFAPFATDDYVIETLRDALTAVAVKDGKVEPVVKDAVQDKLPIKRGLAGEAIVRAGQAEAVPAVRKLLEDTDRPTRLRVGFAFVDKKDKTVIPGMIDLLAELPRDQSGSIEELLSRIAMEKSPNVPLGDDEATRKKCRDAWKEWWGKNGDGIDLAKIELGERLLGYTLFTGRDNNTGMGKVWETDKNGKVRWEITTGLRQPMDAQVIGNDRVLISDFQGREVTERNFKGEVIWKKQVNTLPISSQRLASGNTLIFTRSQILEVDSSGKEVNTITRPNQDILSGQRTKDGNFVIVTNQGQLLQLDSAGKEIKNIPAGIQAIQGMNVDVTPEGHYLIPNYANNQITEIDSDGKAIKTINGAVQPTSVTRLSSGGILAVSQFSQQMYEFDRDGKKISETTTPGQVFRVRRR